MRPQCVRSVPPRLVGTLFPAKLEKDGKDDIPAISGPTIKAQNKKKMRKYRVAYLLTMRFRSLFCFMEKIGGLICRLGRSQNKMTECHRSIYGTKSAGRSRNSRKCERIKSPENKLSSII